METVSMNTLTTRQYPPYFTFPQGVVHIFLKTHISLFPSIHFLCCLEHNTLCQLQSSNYKGTTGFLTRAPASVAGFRRKIEKQSRLEALNRQSMKFQLGEFEYSLVRNFCKSASAPYFLARQHQSQRHKLYNRQLFLKHTDTSFEMPYAAPPSKSRSTGLTPKPPP